MPKRAADDDAAIARLDAAASAALSVVGTDATSQLAVLRALEHLSAALPAGGLVRGLVDVSRRERQVAFVEFHERQLAAAAATDPTGVAAAFDEAIAFTIGVDGEGDGADALRIRKARALAGDGPPRPFFARFLEHQRR
jgi:hypothetical protein